MCLIGWWGGTFTVWSGCKCATENSISFGIQNFLTESSLISVTPSHIEAWCMYSTIGVIIPLPIVSHGLCPPPFFCSPRYYTWMVSGPKFLSHLMTGVLIVGFLIVTCFPIWPNILKVRLCVWWWERERESIDYFRNGKFCSSYYPFLFSIAFTSTLHLSTILWLLCSIPVLFCYSLLCCCSCYAYCHMLLQHQFNVFFCFVYPCRCGCGTCRWLC